MLRIHIDLPSQTLELYGPDGALIRRYPVSTGKAGAGERRGSFQTPRGRHVIRARIGAGQPENAVFVGRRATGEIYSAELGRQYPGRDWILTRILWLSGKEPGFNRLGEVDTQRRYIYIHGAPDSGVTRTPESHGCIRMRSADIMELFDLISAGTSVEISDGAVCSPLEGCR